MTQYPNWTASDIEKLFGSNKGAWDRFVRDHIPLVFAAVRRKLVPAGKGHEAEDVAQDVFLKLVRGDFKLLRGFDPERAKLSTWLTVIATTTAIDHLRRHARPTQDIDALPEGLLSVEAKEYVWINIPDGLLSPRQALVLELLYKQEMEVQEAAAFLKVDPQTVRSTHHKALLKLRQYFATQAESSGAESHGNAV